MATIANIAAYLTKIGWNGEPLSEITWTLIIIVIATILNLIVLKTRNLREFAAVGVWALFAIFIRHKDSLEMVAYSALGGSIILFAYMLWHSFKNKKTNPFFKSFS